MDSDSGFEIIKPIIYLGLWTDQYKPKPDEEYIELGDNYDSDTNLEINEANDEHYNEKKIY